ncbi:MAG: winged helix-turn-helix domain-containing protein [Gammaproteobacteria bacterium]
MMRPLTITYRITTKQISNLVRTEKDGRVRQRLMAMKFISQKQTIPQTARRMDISERPLRKWLHRFNKQGPNGLCDAPRSGQPPKLNAKRIEKLKQRIRKGVTEQDNICSLRGKDLQKILQKEFKAQYSLGGTYFLLHRLGFSCLCPRQRHPQADIQAQETFKKSTPRGH